jgi:hypothetical protein
MKSSTPRFLALLVLALFVAGCDSTGNGPAEVKKVYAGKDSRFTYNRQDKSDTGVPISGSDSTIIAVVVEGPHPFEGKDSVITVVENGTDTMHMAYEPSGDVSIYSGLDLPGFALLLGDTLPKWTTLPVVTKGELPITSLDLDFTIDIAPLSVTIKKIVAIADYKTTELIAVNGENLSSSKVEVLVTVNFELSGFPSTLNFRTGYWYASKIGYFSKFDITNDPLPIPGAMQNSVKTLTSFSLK